MSNEVKRDLIVLLDELLDGVKHLGVKGVTTLLQNARSKTLSVVDKNVEFVFNMVSNHYLIPIDEIVGRSKVVKKRIALAFCIYYLHNNFQYSYTEISNLFKRDKSRLSRMNTMIKNEIGKKKSTINEAKLKFDFLVNNYLNQKEN
jgi:chromosomal replication initiation ATPase DnaA